MNTSIAQGPVDCGNAFASMPFPCKKPKAQRGARRQPAAKRDVALSLKEREALTWTAAGKTAAEVATILEVSPWTVTKHIHEAMQKLGCTKKIQAVTTALRMGMLIDTGTRLRLDSSNVEALTDKELDLLRWADAGKSAWETGMILHVSEQTATYHLEAATRKLNCVNKVQAVAAAISLGLID